MNIARKNNSKAKLIRPVYLVLLILSIAYILLLYKDAVILRPNGHGRAEILILSVTVAIPEIIIWTIAFLSSVRLKSYAKTIKGSADGKAMAYLADALLLMSVYIVLICSSYGIAILFKGRSDMHTIVLVENYLPLGVAFASSLLLAFSAKHFSRLVPRKLPGSVLAVATILFIIVVGLFTWRFSQTHPDSLIEDSVPRFVSSVNTLLYAYVLPQVVLWGMGLLACLHIANYSVFVRGTIYKSLLANLYKGVLIVFICIFWAQLLILTNFTLNKFSFPLLLVYCLLMLGTIGFALIYKGTNDLSKLEKI